MTAKRVYASPGALRIALEDRLKRAAIEEGVDLQRLRRQVAFDRLLARMFFGKNANWALKGGYAMELRMREARTTKDIDVTRLGRWDFSVRGGDPNTRIREELQDCAAIDLGDYFHYLIGESIADIEGAPYGGARYPINARLDGRTFAKFSLDVGLGDPALDPVEIIEGRDWLGFAGIEAMNAALISCEQQFAEKLHAYSLPDRPAPNSRVKDLVDMVLLIERGEMDEVRVRTSLEATFVRRKTHPVPARLRQPMDIWKKPFAAIAQECGLPRSLEDAFHILDRYFDRVVASA